MRISTNTLVAASLCAALFGCTAEAPEGPTPSADISKDDARAMAGKDDHWDLCEWFDWYGDGECDEFCSEPDPDCEGSCRADSDCPPIYCVRAPCPQSACVAGECVIDNPEDRCDAGERECQTCGDNYVCTPHDAGCPLVRCRPPSRCAEGEQECSTCGESYVCRPEGDECPAFDCPPPAERCGGIAGFTCSDPDQFCDYEESAMCGAADQMGECRDVPTVCTREFDPVCGCDGETYSNSCNAAARGVSVASRGACEEPEVGCRRAGCSSQLCVSEDSPPVFSTCEFRPEYGCYRAAPCERQADGECGHTDSPELQACLIGE